MDGEWAPEVSPKSLFIWGKVHAVPGNHQSDVWKGGHIPHGVMEWFGLEGIIKIVQKGSPRREPSSFPYAQSLLILILLILLLPPFPLLPLNSPLSSFTASPGRPQGFPESCPSPWVFLVGMFHIPWEWDLGTCSILGALQGGKIPEGWDTFIHPLGVRLLPLQNLPWKRR